MDKKINSNGASKIGEGLFFIIISLSLLVLVIGGIELLGKLILFKSVKVGTETYCEDCNRIVFDGTIIKKVGFFSDLNDYKISRIQGLCEECGNMIVKVKSGNIVRCSRCGITISSSIEEVSVVRKDLNKYSVIEEYRFCNACEEKLKRVNKEYEEKEKKDNEESMRKYEERQWSSGAKDQEIVEYARKFRAVKTKYEAMEYELNYKTVSSELNTKAVALKNYYLQEYMPTAKNFSSLLSTYNNRNGGAALRDLAVKNDFLDLMR